MTRRRAIGRSDGNQRAGPQRGAAAFENQRLQSIFRLGERGLRAVGVQLEVGELGLRGDHVDGREQALLLLAAVAFVLLASNVDGVELHLQIVVRVNQLPNRPARFAAPPASRAGGIVGRKGRFFLRDIDGMAIVVVAQVAPQRLGVLENSARLGYCGFSVTKVLLV